MVKIARRNQGGMLSLQWDSLYFKHLQPVALSLTLSDYFHLGESDQLLFIRALDPDYIVLVSMQLGHWRRQWHPTPVLLPGKSHGWRSLEGCSPWGHWESDMTEWLHFHFSLSCIGEGNGNPFQCSCLENPRDGGAWWAAVYGVAQSRTPLKRLSSSSSRFVIAFLPGSKNLSISWLQSPSAVILEPKRINKIC